MTIKKKKAERKIQIDLTGPRGNAFYLLGLAQTLAKRYCYTEKQRNALLEDMKSSDYEHLLQRLDKEFGHIIDFYR